MRSTRFIVALSIPVLLAGLLIGVGKKSPHPSPQTGLATPQKLRATLSSLPLSFEINRGQTSKEVKYLARGREHTLFLTPTEAVLALKTRDASVVRMKLIGANPRPQMSGREPLPGRTNYLIGNDQSKWQTDVESYARVEYQDVWPGINLVYYGNEQQLEYDFIVAPGAHPRAIDLSFVGATDVSINTQGEVVLRVGGSDLVMHRPVVYQEVDNVRHSITGRYLITGEQRVGFEIKEYDATRPLIIDPVLSYSSYLGGNNDDRGLGIAIDSAGNAYVVGETYSTNFPKDFSFGPPVAPFNNVFITKINAAGTSRVYSTFLGGSAGETGYSIAVDTAGNAYLTGLTGSSDFPTTTGAYDQTLASGIDAFVTKLNPAGNALIYSTYLGGSNTSAFTPGTDQGFGIAIDSSGNAYVVGATSSTNFPTTANAYDTTLSVLQGSSAEQIDYFVTKLNASGSALLYSTYLGGIRQEETSSRPEIAVDTAGNIYVVGTTRSNDFPTTSGAYARNCHGDCINGSDIIVAKFNPNANGAASLVYSTYFGGTANDTAEGLALDGAGNVYLTGGTLSTTTFPITPGAFQTTINLFSAYVTKLNLNATGPAALVYSTFLTSNNGSNAAGIAVNSAGEAYVIGGAGASFPLLDQIQVPNGNLHIFVTKLNPAGSALIYSTYYGGSSIDSGEAIAVDAAGNAYITGFTQSADLLKSNPFQPNPGSVRDAFIAKLSTTPATPHLVLAPAQLEFEGETGGENPPTKEVILTNTGGGVLNWQASATTSKGGSWLSVTPSSGSLAANQSVTLTVAVNDFDLLPDSYEGGLTVTAPDADNSPRQLPVTLNVGCPSESNNLSQSSDSRRTSQVLCNDYLALSEVMPPAAPIFIPAVVLKQGGLSARVFYELISFPRADLVLRVFDQDGVRVGSSDIESVERREILTPPIQNKLLSIPGNRINLRPAGGIKITSLRMYALLIDPINQTVIKRSEEIIYSIEDRISIVNPTINGIAAPNQSQYPGNGMINFKCDLEYLFGREENGFIRLKAIKAVTGELIRQMPIDALIQITSGTQKQTRRDVSFRLDVPSDAQDIIIVAEILIAEPLPSLIQIADARIGYRRSKLKLELGTSSDGSIAFAPYADLALPSGADLAIARLYARFTYDLAEPKGEIKLLMFAGAANGTTLGAPEVINVKKDLPEGMQKTVLMQIGNRHIPHNVDRWVFTAVLSSEKGLVIAESEFIIVPIIRLHLKEYTITPPPRFDGNTGNQFLINTQRYEFKYKLEYQTVLDERFTEIELHTALGDGDKGSPSSSTPLMAASGIIEKTFTFVPEKLEDPNDENSILFALEIFFKFSVYPRELLGEPASENLIFDIDYVEEIKSGENQTPIKDGNISSNSTTNRNLNQAKSKKGFKGVLDEVNAFVNGADHANNTRAVRTEDSLRDFISINSYWQFNPPIPRNSGFTADLTLNYDVSLFPDDPNFSEANLKMLAYDPATGRLEVLPTTLDLVGKKATAHVNGLAPYYTLAVIGPFAQRTISFNLPSSAADLVTRLIFLNLGEGVATLGSSSYDTAGAINHGPNASNPLPIQLAQSRQLSQSASDLFNLDSLINRGWVQFKANKNNLAGYQIIGDGNRRDGLAAMRAYPVTAVLPEMIIDATRVTEVHLANISNFNSTLKLELHATTGTQVASYQMNLSPKEKLAADIRNLFPTLTSPFTGYLIVRADQELAAAELIISETEIAALNGESLASVNTPSKLYGASIMANTNALTTQLNLVNPTERAANLTLRLVGSAGADLAAPVNLGLDPGRQTQREIRSLFGLSASAVVAGSLIVDSNITGIVGNLNYSNPSGTTAFRSSLALTSTRTKAFAFAHVDNRNGNFTRLALLNTNAQAANVTVKVYRADGSIVGMNSVQVLANSSYSAFLGEVVAASAGQEGGYFIVSSSQQISADAAFGTISGSTLSALPGQPVEETGIILPNVITTSGTSLTIPITVGDLTGRGIVAYDFDLAFDAMVLQPQSPAFDATGTLSSSFSITANPTTGRLRVSAFGISPIAGSGTLLNLKFNVIGASGRGAGLTWQRFVFNEDVQAGAVSGSLLVARTAACASAASFAPNNAAPESIVAVFGTSLASNVEIGGTIPLPTELLGTSVRVKDSLGIERLAPLFFVSPGQINYQIPAGTVDGPATVTIRDGAGGLSIAMLQIARTTPGVFSATSDGRGLAAAQVFRIKGDGSQSFEPVTRFDGTLGRFVAVPIDLGPATDQVFLVIYGTGIRGRSGEAGVNVSTGGVNAGALYAGPTPGFIGLDQVNVALSRSLIGRGEVDIILMVDGKVANTVKVNIK